MTILTILKAPNPMLSIKAKEVQMPSMKIMLNIKNMFETMRNANGIGLSGNQVGILERIIVIDIKEENAEHVEGFKTHGEFSMINPKITNISEENNVYNEGCLSFPDRYKEIERPKYIEVSYLDVLNNKHTIKAADLLATCIQHEIDHLDGKTIFPNIATSQIKNLNNNTQGETQLTTSNQSPPKYRRNPEEITSPQTVR